jgi:hypothetical protein
MNVRFAANPRSRPRILSEVAKKSAKNSTRQSVGKSKDAVLDRLKEIQDAIGA